MEVKITVQIFGSVWFTMNAQQRQKHFSREHSLSLSDADSLSNLCVSNASSGATLSMDVDSVAKSCMYRRYFLKSFGVIIKGECYCSSPRSEFGG